MSRLDATGRNPIGDRPIPTADNGIEDRSILRYSRAFAGCGAFQRWCGLLCRLVPIWRLLLAPIWRLLFVATVDRYAVVPPNDRFTPFGTDRGGAKPPDLTVFPSHRVVR